MSRDGKGVIENACGAGRILLALATPFLRRRLARVLPLKRTPALSFRHDPSLTLGSETLSLLQSLADDEKA